MKYQLIKPVNKNYSAIEQILTNRGIDLKEIPHYLNSTDKDINDFMLFGKDNLKAAAALLGETINQNKKCIIIVD